MFFWHQFHYNFLWIILISFFIYMNINVRMQVWLCYPDSVLVSFGHFVGAPKICTDWQDLSRRTLTSPGFWARHKHPFQQWAKMVFAGDCKQRDRWRLEIIDRAICPLVFRTKKSQYVRKRGRLLWHSHKSGLEVPERVRTVTVEQLNRLLSLLAFFSQQLRNLSCPSFPERKKNRERDGRRGRASERFSLHDLHESDSSAQLWPVNRLQAATHCSLIRRNTWTHTNPDTCAWLHLYVGTYGGAREGELNPSTVGRVAGNYFFGQKQLPASQKGWAISPWKS